MKKKYKIIIAFVIFYTIKAILYLTIGAALWQYIQTLF